MTAAGDLDRRIILDRWSVIDDGYQDITRWTPIADVWASYTPVSDGERFASGAVRSDITARFRIRFRDDVSTKDRVIYAGKTYKIVAVKEVGRRQYLEITGALADE